MGKRLLIVCAVLTLTTVLLGLETGVESRGPEATAQALLAAVRNLAEAKDKESEAKTARTISENIDIAGICKSCLRDTWNKLSEPERRNFVGLFQEVLEKVAYPKSAKFFKGTRIEVEPALVEQRTAKVNTVVTHPEEGMVEVTYRLSPVAGEWLIQDVELDGVSLVIDLRTQIQKILREKSYEELKRRIRDKIAEG